MGEVTGTPLLCRSAGWLLYDGDDCKVVVPHITEEQDGIERQGCGDMTIPTCAILRILDLADPRAAAKKRKRR